MQQTLWRGLGQAPMSKEFGLSVVALGDGQVRHLGRGVGE